LSLLAIPAHVITNTGAALFDGTIQDCPNGAAKPIGFMSMHRFPLSIRMKPSLKQRFVRIDIADPGQDTLVQQDGLEASPSPGQACSPGT
jgi:hypothetical protein